MVESVRNVVCGTLNTASLQLFTALSTTVDFLAFVEYDTLNPIFQGFPAVLEVMNGQPESRLCASDAHCIHVGLSHAGMCLLS